MYAVLQLLTFLWNHNFCIDYCTVAISIILIQLLTFKSAMVIDICLCTIASDYFCMHQCNWQHLFGLLQLRTTAQLKIKGCLMYLPLLFQSSNDISMGNMNQTQMYQLYDIKWQHKHWLQHWHTCTNSSGQRTKIF